MRDRIRAWLQQTLDETHSAGFELVRHFLGCSFDSEMFAAQGEWQAVAIRSFAALVSVGTLMFPSYWQRYRYLLSSPHYHQGLRDDVGTFVAIAMWITALLTAVEWQSLFPSRRDYLALASLPVRPRQIFTAKFLALLILIAGLALTLAVPTAVLFGIVSSGQAGQALPFASNALATFCAIGGACLSVFFALAGLQGILLNLLPANWFARISTTVQGLVFVLTLGVLPSLGKRLLPPEWWPPNWFLGLWAALAGAPDAAPRTALLALEWTPAIAVLSYLLSYHRYRRLLLESTQKPTQARMPVPPVAQAFLPVSLFDRFIRDPREQAAFTFIWKSLQRSRGHRLVLLAYLGIALGFLLKGASLSTQGLHASSASARFLVVLGPVCAAIFVTVGLRYLFSLPLELRANWIFQMTEREGRALWMRAVPRFVVCCGIAPVFLCTLPLAAAVLGPVRAVAAGALGFTLALAVFEVLFVPWNKLPFTCSYLPGKRNLLQTLGPYAWSLLALAVIGQLYLYSAGEPRAFLSVFTFQVAAWWRLRKMRQKAWATRPLTYEEEREPEVISLGLYTEVGLVGQAVSPARRSGPDLTIPEFQSMSPTWLPTEDRGNALYWLETIFEDVRYGLRLIRKNLALSAVLVLTLTIGIGMNVSVFTLINAIALRARVDRDPGSFVAIVSKYLGGGRSWFGEVSHQDYLAYTSRTHALTNISAWSFASVSLEKNDPGTRALLVSCNFFAVYGLDRPRRGRLFRPDECSVPGQAPVAIVSEELWRDRLGADPHLVGKVIQLNEQAFTVVGIAPAGFYGRINRAALWIPYTAQPLLEPELNRFQTPDASWLVLNGRLAPGVSRFTAEAELAIIARQQDRLNPGRRTTLTVTNGSMISQLDARGRGADAWWLLAFTMIAMSLVLLITCANVTTLLLSRAVARQREIAVRLSLGAARVRLLRMLLTESFLIAGLAGAASVWMSYRVPAALFQYLAKQPPDFPLAPDWLIFAYIGGVVLVAGLLSGVAPAVESLKVDLTACLKGCGSVLGRAAAGAGMHGLLVGAQVAMSLVLLVTAAFFGQAHWKMFHTEHSFPTRRILVVPLRFPVRTTAALARSLYRRIAEPLASLPGVQSVTYDGIVPLVLPNIVKVTLAGQGDDAAHPVDVQLASPAYFRTMDIPLVAGREFRDRGAAGEFATAPTPAVVSESFLRVFNLRGDPLGKTLAIAQGPTIEIIGVARDITGASSVSGVPMAYTAGGLDPWGTNLLIRFDRPAEAYADAVRTLIANVNPDLKVAPRSLQAFIDDAGADVWRVVELVLILGATAFVLAVTGIYGAVAFTVTQRTKDLGIRVALGAQRLDIMREILASGGKPVMQGLAVGLWFSLAAAAATAEAFRFTPVHLDTANPLMYAGSALLLAVAALAAMLGPARRAASSDALSALRSE